MSYKDRYFNQSMRIKYRENDRRYNCALDILVNYEEGNYTGGEVLANLYKARGYLNEILYGKDGTKNAPTYGADRYNPDAIQLLREINIIIRDEGGDEDENC
jgi:hypothetical protein